MTQAARCRERSPGASVDSCDVHDAFEDIETGMDSRFRGNDASSNSHDPFDDAPCSHWPSVIGDWVVACTARGGIGRGQPQGIAPTHVGMQSSDATGPGVFGQDGPLVLGQTRPVCSAQLSRPVRTTSTLLRRRQKSDLARAVSGTCTPISSPFTLHPKLQGACPSPNPTLAPSPKGAHHTPPPPATSRIWQH